MGLLRLIHLYLCIIVLMVVALGLSNSAQSMVLLRFDQAPLARTRVATAVFRYSVFGLDGTNPCKKNNGCSICCELDGQTLRPCPADRAVLENLTVNHEHHFRLNVTTKDGERNSSSYSWFIDTTPPTATIFSQQSYTSAEKLAIDVTFSEACTGKGGFKCLNSSYCDIIVSGPASIDASSLSIIEPEMKYSLDIILSPTSTYARVVIGMENNFCTDLAGNLFTRTNGSVFVVHLDRRPVKVDLWTSIPSYELAINGVPRTITATNKMEALKVFLDFSSPIINSTEQILNAFHLTSGVIRPIQSRGHGNRNFVFELKNISRTEIITVELEAASVVGRTGTPLSPVAPITFLYDCTEPGVWLSTSSLRVTEESYINVIIEFTKPIFGFEVSKIEAEGGSLTRFEELSRALYLLTVLAESQDVSVFVPAGKVYDISGNPNLASNQLEFKHYSAPAISTTLHSFMSVGILATSLAAAVLSLSSANLDAIDTLATGSTSAVFSDPSMNLHGMIGHLQVFVLSDWFSDSLPVEYSETTKGLRWLIPREKVPWKRASSSIWPNHLYPAEVRPAMKVSGFWIGFPTRDSITFYHLQQRLRFPIPSHPKRGWPHGQLNLTIKNTPYGLPLDSSEYFTHFLQGEPLSATSVTKRLGSYTGWQDLELNLFWLGVGGGGLLMFHTLTLLFLRWRTQTSAHGILSVPRFELFLLILMLPCISQSSAFVIRGGTTGGILTGALLLAIPAGLIVSVCLFLVIAIFSGSFAQYKEVKHICTQKIWYTKLWLLFTGRPTIGKWFYIEGLPSSFLPRFGILFENLRGPPFFVSFDQNDPNSIPKWTESGQNGIERMRAISSDNDNEDTKLSTSKRLLGCARSSYVILDLMRRVSLGILSGVDSSRSPSQSLFALVITLVQLLYLSTLKPYIRRGVHVVESVCLLCEVSIFGLFIGLNGSNPIKESNLGYLILAFFFIAFVSQIINEWYAIVKCLLRFSQPPKNSFKLGLKYAIKGLLLPLLPRRHWSRTTNGSLQRKTGLAAVPPSSPEMEFERRDARPPHVDPLSAMTATVVPVLSPGSPDLSTIPVTSSTTTETTFHGLKTGEGKRLKGLRLAPKREMKKLRELARASFPGVSKCEEASTSYGFRV